MLCRWLLYVSDYQRTPRGKTWDTQSLVNPVLVSLLPGAFFTSFLLSELGLGCAFNSKHRRVSWQRHIPQPMTSLNVKHLQRLDFTSKKVPTKVKWSKKGSWDRKEGFRVCPFWILEHRNERRGRKLIFHGKWTLEIVVHPLSEFWAHFLIKWAEVLSQIIIFICPFSNFLHFRREILSRK